MGFIGGIVKRLIKLIFYLGLVVAFIVLIPNLPPYTKFTRIELEPTQPRVGPLAPNDVLNNAQALYKDKLLGPEVFQLWNGEIYTGLATGEIVKISPGGHVTFVTKIGQPCAGIHHEHICGRPLGFVIDEKNKHIYVADAYLGIWKVDLATDKKQLLVSPRVPIDGRVPKIFNSVALDKNGDLYWTDSSSDFHLKDGVFTALVDPSGRLFHYNSAKNISKVLLDDLWFANGVLISPDNQFVLVAESFMYRILKYYIDGPKKGTSEVFVAGLPGVPDVIRALPDGSGVLTSLYIAFDDDSPLLSRTMSSAPLARKLIARLARLIEIPFEFLQSQFPNYIFESIVYKIGHFTSLSLSTPEKTGLIQMDWNGNIVASYFNTDRSLLHISDVIVYNNMLYTACPHLQNFIGAVPAPPQLIKAFNAYKAKEQPKVESKATESNKPKVEQKKDVPKNAKPVTQATPRPTTTSKSTTKSNDIPQEKVVKQSTPPKEIKSKSAPKESERVKIKEADIKQEEVKKDEKPKVVPKQSEEKPTVAPKETDTKAKVSASQAEAKPKVAPKVVDLNLKATPQNTPQLKPEIKNQETQGKPVKETESKAKASKTNDVKSEPSKKEPLQSKTSADQPGTKATTKAPGPESDRQNAKTKSASEPKPTKAGGKESAKSESVPETIPKASKTNDVKSEPSKKEPLHSKTSADQPGTKATTKAPEPESDRQNAKTKSASEPKPTKAGGKESAKSESVPETIPIKEYIPSDTAKPNKKTLKVIKKSGPQEIPNPVS